MPAVPKAMHRPSQPTPFVPTMVIPPSLLTSVIRHLDRSRRKPMLPVRETDCILDHRRDRQQDLGGEHESGHPRCPCARKREAPSAYSIETREFAIW